MTGKGKAQHCLRSLRCGAGWSARCAGGSEGDPVGGGGNRRAGPAVPRLCGEGGGADEVVAEVGVSAATLSPALPTWLATARAFHLHATACENTK